MKKIFISLTIIASINLSCSVLHSRSLESNKIFTVPEALQLYNENKNYFTNNYILIKSCGVSGLDCVSDCELIIWHVDPQYFTKYKNSRHKERLGIETIIIKPGPLNKEQKNNLIGKLKCGIYKGYFKTHMYKNSEKIRFLVDETIIEKKIKKIKSPGRRPEWEIPAIELN